MKHSEPESSRSAITENDDDQKARRQDRRHHQRNWSALSESAEITVFSDHVADPSTLVEREREMIENALREAAELISGPTGAATKLGIPRQTLESKIRKLGINR